MAVLLLRILLGLGWLALLVITLVAADQLGLLQGGLIFFDDFDNPWRAQFHLDLILHLLLMGSWMIYRARSMAVGVVLAAVTLVAGSLFSIPYVFIASLRAHGDVRQLLLGRHA